MKTRMIFMAILALSIAFTFSSCEKIKGKGEVITESRTTGSYSSISLAMSATVYYAQGPNYSLAVSGQENVLRQIVTEVEGSSLVIRVKSGVILGNHEPVHVYITSPAIANLEVSGSGDIFTEDTISMPALSVDISGSGNVNLAYVIADQLNAKISGSGTIRAAAGKANREDLKISGSGTIDLRSVESGTVYTTTSGSGETFLHAINLLDVVISGSGNIWYYGTPVINTHISGSGNLRRM